MSEHLIKLLIVVMSWLPLPLARSLGWLVGEVAWRRKTRGAVTTLINLDLCLPELTASERRALARRSLQQWGMTLFETPIVWRRGLKALGLIRAVNGQPLMDAALADDRGLILLSPHLGNWELTGLWLSRQAPTTILYQPPRQAKLEELVKAGRGKAGAKLVPTDLRGVSALIKALKRGEVTGILPDMEPDRSGGIFARFFGIQALTMTLVHNLQHRGDAAVLLAFARRVPRGFVIEVLEPEKAIYDKDPAIGVAAMNRLVEQSARMAPEQYQWEYKRFKQRPEGEDKLYPKGI